MKVWKLAILVASISVITLGAVLVWAITTQGDELRASLLRLRPITLLMAAGLHVCALALWGLRITTLTHAADQRVRFTTGFEAVYAGVFAAALTPARLGGEAARFLVLRSRGVEPRVSALLVLLERALDITLMVVLALVALLVVNPGSPTIRTALEIATGLAAFTLALGILVVFRPGILHPLLAPLRWFNFEHTRHRVKVWIEREAHALRQGLALVVVRRPWSLPAALVLTTASWTAEFGVVYTILHALGKADNPLLIGLALVVVILVSSLPATPGAVGVTEVVALAALAPVAGTAAPVAVLAWRVCTFFMDLIVGGIVSMRFTTREVFRTVEKTKLTGAREKRANVEP